MYVFDNEGNPAGKEEDGYITTTPNIAGARLADWIVNGVPGIRGEVDGDDVIDSETVIKPTEPLFGLALLDHFDRLGWSVHPGAVELAVNFDATQKRDHSGKWTKYASAGAAASAQLNRVPLPDPSEVKVLKTLPGGTHPKLVVDNDGKQWVMKKTDNHGHLISEATADAVYRALGVPTVNSGIVHTVDGPVKFSEFMKNGQTLSEWKQGKTKAEVEAMHAEIGKHFAVDALMGNWDVIGTGSNNVLIKDGVPYRIDNGGALEYRALGTKKKASEWGPNVLELKSLKDHNINSDAAKVFEHLTPDQIKAQVADLAGKKIAILEAIKDPKIKATLMDRISNMEAQVAGMSVGDKTPDLAKLKKDDQLAAPKATLAGLQDAIAKAEALKATEAPPPSHATPGGKFDPTKIDDIVGHITKNPGDATFAPLYKDKLKFLNPDGVKNGVFFIPMFPTGEASSLKKVAQLEKELPPGTTIKKKKVSAEDLAKAGFKAESEKVAKATEPKPTPITPITVAPDFKSSPQAPPSSALPVSPPYNTLPAHAIPGHPYASAMVKHLESLPHVTEIDVGKAIIQKAVYGTDTPNLFKHYGLNSENNTWGELAEKINAKKGGAAAIKPPDGPNAPNADNYKSALDFLSKTQHGDLLSVHDFIKATGGAAESGKLFDALKKDGHLEEDEESGDLKVLSHLSKGAPQGSISKVTDTAAVSTPSVKAKPNIKLSIKAKNIAKAIEAHADGSNPMTGKAKVTLSGKFYSLGLSEQNNIVKYLGAPAGTNTVHQLIEHAKLSHSGGSSPAAPSSPPPPPPPATTSKHVPWTAAHFINKSIDQANAGGFNATIFKSKFDKLAETDKKHVLKHLKLEHESDLAHADIGNTVKASPKAVTAPPLGSATASSASGVTPSTPGWTKGSGYVPPDPKPDAPPLPTAPTHTPPDKKGGQANGGEKPHKSFPAGNPGDSTVRDALKSKPVSGGEFQVKRSALWDIATNKKWADALTQEEQSTIGDWKGSATSLRMGYAKDEHLIPGTASYHNYSALLKCPPHEGVVYRGIHGAYAENLVKACQAALDNPDPSQHVWSDKSAHGYSPNPTVAMKFSSGDVMIRSHVKTARPIHKAGHSFTSVGDGVGNEMEIVGLPKTRYKIKSIASNVTVVDPATGSKKVVAHVIDIEEIT